MDSNRRNNGRKSEGCRPDGRFAAGNPGRLCGARHKASQAIDALLEGEAEGLTRTAVNMALQGDTTALRLCLERVCRRGRTRPCKFDLPPMESAEDAAQAADAIARAVAQGELTPIEGASVTGLVEKYRRTLEMTEMECRMAELERVFGVSP